MKEKLFVTLLLFCVQLWGVEGANNLYRVSNISSNGDYYIIVVMRNDSLFKIISRKNDIKLANNERIKKGHSYRFDLNCKNDSCGDKVTKPLCGIANYLDVTNKKEFIDGNTRIKFTKRYHYRIYMTKNLVGLYYVP
ncbi:MAG: hypothetical protein RIS29_2840 [Bacteroidota bacterium]|jgi:hypothetical protein